LQDLAKDLELHTLLQPMADGDQFLFDVARAAIHSGLASPDRIVYRQRVLADCIAQPAVVRDLYQVAVTALTEERKIFGWIFRDSPESILHRSRQAMELFVTVLRALRDIADAHAAGFRSEGFTRFFAMIEQELNDGYFAEMDAHLAELAFRRGTLIRARLGRGAKGAGYALLRQPQASWRERLPGRNRDGYGFTIPERDENGFRGGAVPARRTAARRDANVPAARRRAAADQLRGGPVPAGVRRGVPEGLGLTRRRRSAARRAPGIRTAPAAQVTVRA
jgi:hypothetical protein